MAKKFFKDSVAKCFCHITVEKNVPQLVQAEFSEKEKPLSMINLPEQCQPFTVTIAKLCSINLCPIAQSETT